MIKRIAITGPESTGKSWMASRLAKHYQTVWVEEFAREFLVKQGGNYSFRDIVKIAQGQKKNEQLLLAKANKLLFADTEPIVTKIWSEVVFGRCDRWIVNEIESNPYDFYLLCYPDLPWEPDPLRENPDNRLELFELYKKELVKYSLNFKIVKGAGELRLANAVKFVDEFLM